MDRELFPAGTGSQGPLKGATMKIFNVLTPRHMAGVALVRQQHFVIGCGVVP
jgi:hypothetical protein